MGKIILLLFLLLFACGNNKEYQRKDLKDITLHPVTYQHSLHAAELQGNVKSVDVKVFRASGTKGNVTVGEQDTIRAKRDRYPRTYNRSGLVAWENGFDHRTKSGLKREYLYDNKHRISKQKILKNDSLLATIVTLYNDDTLCSITEIGANGDTISTQRKIIKTVDDTTRVRSYKGDTLLYSVLYKANGDVLEQKSRMGKYVTDLKKEYMGDTLLRSSYVKYLEGEKDKGKVMHSLYNKKGHVTDRYTTDVWDTPQSYSYAYDGQGNWIEQVLYYDNRAVAVTKRTIKYYK